MPCLDQYATVLNTQQCPWSAAGGTHHSELDKVKQEVDRFAFLVVVHANAHECLVVWRGPTIRGDVYAAVNGLQVRQLLSLAYILLMLTCNMSCTWSCAASTMAFTSCEIWSREGSRRSGLPLSTMLLNAASSTILNGRAFSAHQAAHSTLQQCYQQHILELIW